MNILITGGTGFIGSALVADFQKSGDDVTILTRAKDRAKASGVTLIETLDEIAGDAKFDLIVNLAGAPISERWSKAYKQKLIDSRFKVTGDLHKLVKRLKTKPAQMISASAIGYYGNQGDLALTENSEPFDDFTHQLCDQWEKAAMAIEAEGVKVMVMRIGVVLGLGHGILKKTLMPFKMGMGGKLGSGDQMMSWVHIDDVVGAVRFLRENGESGAYNVTAPVPISNLQWTKSFASALSRPALMPLPSAIVKLAFGEMGQALLLDGQKVLPERITKAGYAFQYPSIDQALAQIFP